MAHAIDGTLGVKTTDTSTTKEFALGATVNMSDGSCYRYLEADSALAAYAAVAAEEDFGCAELTTTISGAEPNKVLIPQVAVASGSFGWGLETGPGSVLALASCAADVKMYTTATAGALDDTATDLVNGLRLTAANGTATAAVACFATTPMVTNAQD